MSKDVVISLCEFIENEKEDVSKQDCEMDVAKRLLGKIKNLPPDVCMHPEECPVCDRAVHDAMPGKIPLGIPFHAKRNKAEKPV